MWKKRTTRLTSDGDWAVTEGTHEGNPIIVRFDRGAAGLPGNTNLSIQIGIAIPFNNPTDEGSPPTQELAALEAIEDSIVHHAGKRARLVAVITTAGMREFVLYTRDADWIPAFHQTLRQSSTTHEVQMVANRDPDWSVYKQLSTAG